MGNTLRTPDEPLRCHANKLRRLPFEKPTQKDYDFLGHFSDLDTEEIRETIEKFLVDHPDGRMNGIDFCNLYHNLRKDSTKDMIDRISQNIFRALCSRSSDHELISFKEFLMIFSVTSTKGVLADKLNFVYYLYDIDQSNALDLNEVKEIINGILELFHDPKNLREINSISSDIFKHLKVEQIITKDNFLNGLIENKKFRDMIMPTSADQQSVTNYN